MPASDQGVTLDRYMLIPRVLIFVTRGTRVLLLKGAPTKRLWADKYNGVGGHVERGEDILSAARRELLEETGLSVDTYPAGTMSTGSVQGLRLCGTLVVETGGNPGIGIYVFTGESLAGEPKPSIEGLAQSNVEGTLEWIPFKDLPKYPLVEDLPVLLKRIRMMRHGDPPFMGRSFYQNERMVVEFAE
jgi:8-oxo-dGTP diphosphatase